MSSAVGLNSQLATKVPMYVHRMIKQRHWSPVATARSAMTAILLVRYRAAPYFNQRTHAMRIIIVSFKNIRPSKATSNALAACENASQASDGCENVVLVLNLFCILPAPACGRNFLCLWCCL